MPGHEAGDEPLAVKNRAPRTERRRRRPSRVRPGPCWRPHRVGTPRCSLSPGRCGSCPISCPGPRRRSAIGRVGAVKGEDVGRCFPAVLRHPRLGHVPGDVTRDAQPEAPLPTPSGVKVSGGFHRGDRGETLAKLAEVHQSVAILVEGIRRSSLADSRPNDLHSVRSSSRSTLPSSLVSIELNMAHSRG